MSTPLKFNKITLRNFLSFGNANTEIDLNVKGSTLIMGENLDAISNNGAGKCLHAYTLLNIRNKHTGEICSISIGKFYEALQKSREKG